MVGDIVLALIIFYLVIPLLLAGLAWFLTLFFMQLIEKPVRTIAVIALVLLAIWGYAR
jgi:hypothetical protein